MSETTDGDGVTAPRDAPRPPDPGGIPLFGNVHELASDALGFYERRSSEHGGIVRYDVFGTESYLVTDPDAIAAILVEEHDRFEKGEMPRERLGGLLGDGLFLAEGDAWREQRTAMRSAFFRERVAAYGDAMVEHARRTAASWDDGDVVDVHAAATDYAFAVLAESLLGSDVERERDTVRAAAESVTERFDTGRIASFLPEWIPTPTNRRYRRRIRALRATIRDLVAERRAAGPPANPGAADDLLGTLVAAAELGAIDDDQLVDNAVTFLFAGHETSALGLTYTLYCLARRPEFQARVRAEVSALDADPTPADVRECPALTAAVDEALRLYPPVHSFFREPTEPVTLGGYRVPAGVVLTLSPWAVHRDERWWDDPETYRPERWLRQTDGDEATGDEAAGGGSDGDEGDASGTARGDDGAGPAVGDRPEYAYFPFGGGPRHCIGMRFARQELRLATATLLRRLRLEPVTTELSLRASANTRPTHPVRLRVSALDGPGASAGRGDGQRDVRRGTRTGPRRSRLPTDP
ncbi:MULTISPECIES: cytochrome P450 [unclassified Halorubrum]|uniref:cytochrome P450 n=1 Tax=unclassified Halorubrum TaxID=2642239 RepID=UPI000B99439C|nr:MULTISPECIES: cytochrome P450 [unclassified Halorubrum]OYR45102.1 cytochrome P450 [Halorubrum sp. Hd13]OYR50845.1 cytochrome P450 [Halorubrum sp. Ea8]